MNTRPSLGMYRLAAGECNGNSRHGRHWLAIRTELEAAALLGITEQAVHQAERRALVKLRRALAPMARELGIIK